MQREQTLPGPGADRATATRDASRTRLLASGSLAEQYRDDGVVLMPGLFSTAEIDEVREVFTRSVERDQSLGYDDGLPDGDILRRYPRYVHPHRHLDQPTGQLARHHMLDSRIFEVVTELIGPAWAAQSMFYFKPPGARGQAMHQDETSLRTHPETCVAAWIAVDACDDANGSLMVVPGSHRQDLLCSSPADPDDSFSARGVEVPETMEVVQTVMDPGDVLFFHGHLVHGSHRNVTADRFRRSLIFHYVPTSSVRVANFYDPLIAADGTEVHVDRSPNGGPCGEAWT